MTITQQTLSTTSCVSSIRQHQSADCLMFKCKNRSASTVAECLLDGIILRDGCPLHLHSGAAREFIPKAVKRLCDIIGCRQTTTLAHHPTGNSTIERLWQWVTQCIKLIPRMGELYSAQGTGVKYHLSLGIQVHTIRGCSWITSKKRYRLGL